jgi:hypothetical protein
MYIVWHDLAFGGTGIVTHALLIANLLSDVILGQS